MSIQRFVELTSLCLLSLLIGGAATWAINELLHSMYLFQAIALLTVVAGGVLGLWMVRRTSMMATGVLLLVLSCIVAPIYLGLNPF